MRLTGTSELVVIGGMIAYIAFTPGFSVVRQFLSTSVGKALGLVVFVAVWKYVSHPVALLLLVNYVRCSGMREFMDNPPPETAAALPENTYCPEGTLFDNGQCMNSTTGQAAPATTCLPSQTWDGSKCVLAGTGMTPPPPMPPATMPSPPVSPPSPPTTSTTTMKQPFTNLTPAMVGGVQPDMKEAYENFAPV